MIKSKVIEILSERSGFIDGIACTLKQTRETIAMDEPAIIDGFCFKYQEACAQSCPLFDDMEKYDPCVKLYTTLAGKSGWVLHEDAPYMKVKDLKTKEKILQDLEHIIGSGEKSFGY